MNNRLTFTLMDIGYKKAGAVQIYDERTLDDNGNIIKFPTQLAIVTHYAMLQDTHYANIFETKANDIIACWENEPKPLKIEGLASEPNALQYSLFQDVFKAPFQGPKEPKFTFIDLLP